MLAASAVIGALAGLCLPRLAYRLSVAVGAPPRSACERCARPFPAGLAGWLRPGDRCPACGARLGPPAWLTASATATAGAALAWATDPAGADGWLVLGAFLLVAAAGVLLAAIDLACLRLPDVVVGPVFGGALLLLGAAAAVAGTAADLLRALVGAVLLGGGYLLLALLPGGNLGLGDAKLCLPLGLLLGWLGWGALLVGALVPHLVNGPVVLGLLVAGRAGRRTRLPLGPALLVGALVAAVGHAAWHR